MRNGWVEGEHLMQDDITGFIHYASEMRKTWDGLWVHENVWERHRRNPQEFVKARRDPKLVSNVRAAAALPDASSDTITPVFIGSTTVQTPFWSAAARVYQQLGIPDMVIGTTFEVR